MEKIIRAREYMTGRMKCPVYGTERHFYRFCKEIPFDNENMRRLRKALENPIQPSYPKELRTLSQCQVHSRAEKFIELLEVENWLHSGYTYGSIIRDTF